MLAVDKNGLPRANRPAHENAALAKWIALEHAFGLLGTFRLVDDERPAVVGEWTRDDELAALQQARQIFAMRRAHLGDLGLIRRVFDDGRELHAAISLLGPATSSR